MKHLLLFGLLLGFLNAYSQKADTSEVYFELNIARVSTMASMSLDSLWFAKAVAHGKKTTLLGYGDYLGTEAYNQNLSEDRAKNVRKYLVALGLDENDIVESVGKGRIMHKPEPGQLGFYRDRKVMIITQHAPKKAAKPTVVTKAGPAPKPEPVKVAKKEEPKPAPVKPEPKPIVAKAEPKPAPVVKEVSKPIVAAKTEPKPVPVIKEAPKPIAAQPAPKPVPVKVAAPQPTAEPKLASVKTEAPKPAATVTKQVARRNEKDINTLDPSKLQVNEVIPLYNIFFAQGSNAILRRSEPALDELANFLNNNKNLVVEIQCHICCLDPTDGTDEPDGLGGNRTEGRAKNIYRSLLGKGVEQSRLKFAGVGNKKPVVSPETTDYDRELNNRTTIKILAK